jgi:signal transduction histidine kinase
MRPRKWSLKSLLIAQFVLSAMIPSLLLSSLLISEFRTIQTEEQIKKQRAQTEKAILHVEFEIEKFSLQLQQLSADSNAALAASSGIFAQNARNSLLQIADQHPLAKSVLLVDRRFWIVEAVPIDTMLLSLEPLKSQLASLFTQDYAAIKSTYILSSTELTESLLPTSVEQNQAIPELIVMQVPLKLTDSTVTDPRSKLTGAVIALLPLQSIKVLLEQYSPDATLHNIYWREQALLTNTLDKDDIVITAAPLKIPGLEVGLSIEFATTKATALSAITALTYRFAYITALFLIFLLFVGWFFVRLEVKPITALSKLVERYAEGDLQQPKQHFPFAEFEQIASVLNTMSVKLREHQELLEGRVAKRTIALQQAVAELNQTNSELVKMQQQLVESAKLSQIGILVAGVAREITAPIIKSINAINDLQQENLLIGQAMHNGVLKRSAFEVYLTQSKVNIIKLSQHLRRAEELIQSFKAVAVDQSSEQRRNFILYDYLQQVILSLRYELGQYHAKIEIKGDKILVLQSYPGSFSRILTNLVLNSLQHGFKSDTPQFINIDYSTLTDGQLQIVYRDNGLGMPDEVLARIFEPFYTTAQQSGASGLGLSIVYNIVTQQLKGKIECESELGKGAMFTITLPVRVVIKHRKE